MYQWFDHFGSRPQSHPQPCSDLHSAGGVATRDRTCLPLHRRGSTGCLLRWFNVFSSWLVQFPCSCKIPCLCSVPWTTWTGDRPWDGCRSLPRLGDCIEWIAHPRICSKLNTPHYHRSTSQNQRIICFWGPRNEEMGRSRMNPLTFTFILPLPLPRVPLGFRGGGGSPGGSPSGCLRGVSGVLGVGLKDPEGWKAQNFALFFLLPPQISFFPLSVFSFL